MGSGSGMDPLSQRTPPTVRVASEQSMARKKPDAHSILTAQRLKAAAFSPSRWVGSSGAGGGGSRSSTEATRAGRVDPGEAHRRPLETMTASLPAVLVLSITSIESRISIFKKLFAFSSDSPRGAEACDSIGLRIARSASMRQSVLDPGPGMAQDPAAST